MAVFIESFFCNSIQNRNSLVNPKIMFSFQMRMTLGFMSSDRKPSHPHLKLKPDLGINQAVPVLNLITI